MTTSKLKVRYTRGSYTFTLWQGDRLVFRSVVGYATRQSAIDAAYAIIHQSRLDDEFGELVVVDVR